MRTRMLAGWLCLSVLFSGCSSAVPVEVPPPPAALVGACAEPSRLPMRSLTQAEVERLWGADRDALRDCVDRHRALAAWAVEVATGR